MDKKTEEAVRLFRQLPATLQEFMICFVKELSKKQESSPSADPKDPKATQ